MSGFHNGWLGDLTFIIVFLREAHISSLSNYFFGETYYILNTKVSTRIIKIMDIINNPSFTEKAWKKHKIPQM